MRWTLLSNSNEVRFILNYPDRLIRARNEACLHLETLAELTRLCIETTPAADPLQAKCKDSQERAIHSFGNAKVSLM